MSVEPGIHATLLQSILGSAGGEVWKGIFESLPGLHIYIAGGAVRDTLANRRARHKDFDFFVGGQDVEKLLGQLADAGRVEYGPFGSPRWYPAATAAFYHDVIPIARFFNGLWRCENITDVLNQFDFTANAVGMDMRTGELFDPQNGRRDIRQKVMRAVRFDYPDEPITDMVPITRLEILWFRILHYAAVLGLKIEPVTRSWLYSNRHYQAGLERFASIFFPLHPRWETGLAMPGHA